MRIETKEALYSLLDLMDVIGNIGFIDMDIEKANRIRKDVLEVINGKNDNILDKTADELLGILPSMLLDNNKFTNTKEILFFAEKCLDIEVKNYWHKRSRHEVIGIIIGEVSKQNRKQYNRFLKAWNEFNLNTNSNNKIKDYKLDINEGFMERWFRFFDTYKDVK
ncbi:MAG TPA: hypothetical protein GX707_01620 [Epulopiscium sp.]|nr:hypothetical protein [Candidatus Epulonipiscium sp.]